MSSMSSIQSIHVHFPALLEQPPVDRVRKRGLVYPKLAQSKGSGDRMHSTDLFWGNRKVSAAPSEPEPKELVPRGLIHLSKPVVPAATTETGLSFTAAFIRGRRTCLKRLAVTPTSDCHHRHHHYHHNHDASGAGPLFGLVSIAGLFYANSRYKPPVTGTAAIEEKEDGAAGTSPGGDGGGDMFVPSPPPFLSTPTSSYSSGTSSRSRDSEERFFGRISRSRDFV